MKHASSFAIGLGLVNAAEIEPGNSLIDHYLVETVEFMKRQTNAVKVICFDWRSSRI